MHYRVWFSTEGFADYIVNHTTLKDKNVVKSYLYESDAAKPAYFHTMPDHIRKILYLDAPDIIVELNNEPIFAIEISTEAGTGHNAFQRFSRIAAAVENSVPIFYIYPEATIVQREASVKWDVINPLIFKALDQVMNIYDIPALLYYFPSDFKQFASNPTESPSYKQNKKGLRYDDDFAYCDCPCSKDEEMNEMFNAISLLIECVESEGVLSARKKILKRLPFRERRGVMQKEFARLSNDKQEVEMSPLTATQLLPTEYLLNYLSQFEDKSYQIGELLKNRKESIFYQVDAKFRGDPYAGAIAAIDYLACREGKTFEERGRNVVLVLGKLNVNHKEKTFDVVNSKNASINDFFKDVKQTERHNLLTRDYSALKNREIPRYFMQVRYGSTYSKVKHIRVFSYFADAILFPDGSLWRDN